MNYSIKNNILILNEKEITFDLEIERVLEKDNMLIVLILEDGSELTNKHYQSRNIFGISPDGEILWQVEAPTQDPVDLYTQLTEEDGMALGGSWSGWNCHLDPKTGKILKRIFEK